MYTHSGCVHMDKNGTDRTKLIIYDTFFNDNELFHNAVDSH